MKISYERFNRTARSMQEHGHNCCPCTCAAWVMTPPAPKFILEGDPLLQPRDLNSDIDGIYDTYLGTYN